MPKGLYATEAQEQALVMQWAGIMSVRHPELRMLYHIPNGGSRNRIEGAHLKQQGVKAGVPDLFLPVPKRHLCGLYIEMKRRHGGVVSPEQKRWLKDLREEGYAAHVCRGADEAIKVIKDYLSIKED